MTGERDREQSEPDDATGAFDADAWFRSQFGGEPPAEPPAPPAPAEPPAPPAPPAQPAPPAPPAQPALGDVAPAFAVPPLTSAPPPSSAPVPLPPPPALVEPQLAGLVPPEAVPTEPAAIIEPEPTQPADVVPAGAVLGDAATELIREPEPGEALDQLFGEQSFQEYDDTLIPVVPRSERRASRGSASAAGDRTGGSGTSGEAPTRAPLSQTQKVLLWVAGSLVAVLLLVLVFVLGTRIPLLLGPAPGAEPIASPEPSPTASTDARPIGAVAPGDWRWDELGGGECLEPFVDAWQEQYTVVDCAAPHGGQLVLRAELPLAEGAVAPGPYPGEQVLAAQTLQLCSSAGVLDLRAAGAFTDVVLQAAFPPSEEAWDAGERDYFCFVSRSSGEALTASLAGPGPAPTVLPTPPAGG